jgi:ribosomal protein L11 methylase PrmA
MVWDLGANVGRFSRLASDRNIDTVAFDIDPAAVEKNYLDSRNGETHLLPLLLDLTNPSPGLGWGHEERMSLLERGPVDLVMALALIHHLAISNNVPLEQLARFFSRVGQWLIMEFVPKSDSQVQRLLATREDIFSNYSQSGFEQAFERYFTIRRSVQVEGSERTLYLMHKETC